MCNISSFFVAASIQIKYINKPLVTKGNAKIWLANLKGPASMLGNRNDENKNCKSFFLAIKYERKDVKDFLKSSFRFSVSGLCGSYCNL